MPAVTRFKIRRGSVENKSQLTLVHVAGILTIVMLLVLWKTFFKDDPEIAAFLLTTAGILYGKLGFIPDKSVLSSYLAKLDPTVVAKLSQMPPPLIEAFKIVSEARRESVRPTSLPAAIPVAETSVGKVEKPDG